MRTCRYKYLAEQRPRARTVRHAAWHADGKAHVSGVRKEETWSIRLESQRGRYSTSTRQGRPRHCGPGSWAWQGSRVDCHCVPHNNQLRGGWHSVPIRSGVPPDSRLLVQSQSERPPRRAGHHALVYAAGVHNGHCAAASRGNTSRIGVKKYHSNQLSRQKSAKKFGTCCFHPSPVLVCRMRIAVYRHGDALSRMFIGGTLWGREVVFLRSQTRVGALAHTDRADRTRHGPR